MNRELSCERCVRNFLTVETVSDYETVSPIKLYQSTETAHVSFMLYVILIAILMFLV